MSKAVAINGSPRMERGNTAVVLNPFVEGMMDAGSHVELFYASRLKVKPCSLAESCTAGFCPGNVSIKDKMQLLYPELKEADMVSPVLATPVY